MQRRTFLVAAVVGATAAGRAWAQSRIPRIGLLSAGQQSLAALVEGLREVGYVPGQTIVVAHQRTEGRAERYDAAAEAILKSDVAVMVVGSPHGLAAARRATRTVPIVAVDLESDPVASGYVETLARPGGNITGLFLDLPELSGKLLQLLREAVPGATIGVLYDAEIGRPQLDAAQRAARAAGLTLHPAAIRRADDVDGAVESIARARARALLVLSAPLMRQNQSRIDDAALRNRLASLTLFALRPDGNGFMSYGPDLDDMYRRSAVYVDRLLKGARASELPVERPAKFELALNLKTANALKLTVPPSLRLAANRVLP
jgi:putative ABC transport system substrate-binding protein